MTLTPEEIAEMNQAWIELARTLPAVTSHLMLSMAEAYFKRGYRTALEKMKETV